jgi:N-acetyl-gamma-glutamyl-phosphate reductase
MIRVGIMGATGYTALELIKILLRHPQVDIAVLTSRQEGSPHVGTVHPSLVHRLDRTLENMDAASVAARTDCVFCCLPHAASAETIELLMESDVRVVDLSADYRLDNADVYSNWYGHTHPNPERLRATPYGLPELFRSEIAGAKLVANPGCFPTSAILGLAPLLKLQHIQVDEVIVDSKSGVSGAGRTPKLTTLYPECNESISAYNVGRHRHTPEISQVLSQVAGTPVGVIFTPHLTPMDRGILSTMYVTPTKVLTEPELMDVFRSFYADEPFVRVVDHLPATKDVSDSNFCDITARVVGNRYVVISCIDNLVKGASGAAVQNMNLMFGFPETTALL